MIEKPFNLGPKSSVYDASKTLIHQNLYLSEEVIFIIPGEIEGVYWENQQREYVSKVNYKFLKHEPKVLIKEMNDQAVFAITNQKSIIVGSRVWSGFNFIDCIKRIDFGKIKSIKFKNLPNRDTFIGNHPINTPIWQMDLFFSDEILSFRLLGLMEADVYKLQDKIESLIFLDYNRPSEKKSVINDNIKDLISLKSACSDFNLDDYYKTYLPMLSKLIKKRVDRTTGTKDFHSGVSNIKRIEDYFDKVYPRRIRHLLFISENMYLTIIDSIEDLKMNKDYRFFTIGQLYENVVNNFCLSQQINTQGILPNYNGKLYEIDLNLYDEITSLIFDLFEMDEYDVVREGINNI